MLSCAQFWGLITHLGGGLSPPSLPRGLVPGAAPVEVLLSVQKMALEAQLALMCCELAVDDLGYVLLYQTVDCCSNPVWLRLCKTRSS